MYVYTWLVATHKDCILSFSEKPLNKWLAMKRNRFGTSTELHDARELGDKKGKTKKKQKVVAASVTRKEIIKSDVVTYQGV